MVDFSRDFRHQTLHLSQHVLQKRLIPAGSFTGSFIVMSLRILQCSLEPYGSRLLQRQTRRMTIQRRLQFRTFLCSNETPTPTSWRECNLASVSSAAGTSTNPIPSRSFCCSSIWRLFVSGSFSLRNRHDFRLE